MVMCPCLSHSSCVVIRVRTRLLHSLPVVVQIRLNVAFAYCKTTTKRDQKATKATMDWVCAPVCLTVHVQFPGLEQDYCIPCLSQLYLHIVKRQQKGTSRRPWIGYVPQLVSQFMGNSQRQNKTTCLLCQCRDQGKSNICIL